LSQNPTPFQRAAIYGKSSVHEKELIQNCLECVAQKASRDSVADWTDGNFIELSEAIQAQTGVLIHRNTLKRLFGKMRAGEDLRPQKETRNALARYAGFEDWGAFVLQSEKQKALAPVEEESLEEEREGDFPAEHPNLSMRGDSQSNWMVGIVMLLLMIAAVFYWKSKPHKRPAEKFNRTAASGIRPGTLVSYLS
jgi:hypothetical protein